MAEILPAQRRYRVGRSDRPPSCPPSPPEISCQNRSQKLAVLRTGCKGDTPPLKGCCTVTFGYRARTLLKAEQLR